MDTYETFDPVLHDMRGLKIWLWIAGVATIAFGIAGLVSPFVMTLAAELLFGAVLAALGGFQIIRAVFAGSIESRLWTAVFGLVALTGGVVLLLYPLQGALTLTIVLAAFFGVGGIVKLLGAWQMSPQWRHANGMSVIRGRGWLALSGGLSLLLGMLLFAGLPSTATWALGLLLGIDLMFLGASEIALAIGLSQLQAI